MNFNNSTLVGVKVKFRHIQPDQTIRIDFISKREMCTGIRDILNRKGVRAKLTNDTVHIRVTGRQEPMWNRSNLS